MTITKKKLGDINTYEQLGDFYTSNGMNSDELEKITNLPGLAETYSENMKSMYDSFSSTENFFVRDSYLLELLSSEMYLKSSNKSKEEVLNSLVENYVIMNVNYILTYLKLKDEYNDVLTNIDRQNPLLLVPLKYKDQEEAVKSFYTDKYNELLTYNRHYGVQVDDEKMIDNIAIIYLANNQSYNLFGVKKEATNLTLEDSIIIVDNGNFASYYYLDMLSRGDIFFKLDNRNMFKQIINEYRLTDLVNASTLLTPFMQEVHNIEFMMYHSLMFTLLFLITLIFILFILNYIDINTNRRKYAILYILGFNDFKVLRSNIYISLMLFSLLLVNIFIKYNIFVYLAFIGLDFILLTYFYHKIIKKDLSKIEKGG